MPRVNTIAQTHIACPGMRQTCTRKGTVVSKSGFRGLLNVNRGASVDASMSVQVERLGGAAQACGYSGRQLASICSAASSAGRITPFGTQTMSEEEGWQGRLCATLCAPPIPRLQLDSSAPGLQDRLSRFDKAVWVLLLLGILRSSVVQRFLLADFMQGGTDFFGAILGLLASAPCCAANGSLLVAFLVWTIVNVILFELIFSLGPDLIALCSDDAKAPLLLDIVLMLSSVVLQAWLFRAAHEILQLALPDWMNLVAGTSSSNSSQGLGQAFLEPPRQVAMGVSTQRQTIQPFSGSGQRLGSSGGGRGSGSQGSRLLGP